MHGPTCIFWANVTPFTLQPAGRGRGGEALPVRARPGRLSALSVSHSESGLYGAFVWARRALNGQKRRFPARAVTRRRSRSSGSSRCRQPRRSAARGASRARSHCRFAPPLIRFIPYSRTYAVPLFLKRQCDRTLDARRPPRRRSRPRARSAGCSTRALEAAPGLGRIVTLYCRSSTSHWNR